jgi:hypothetical protein
MAIQADMPTMLASEYNSAIYDANAFGNAFGPVVGHPADPILQWGQTGVLAPERRMQPKQPSLTPVFIEENTMAACRIVKVIIADTNENLPLEDRILLRGEEKFTDATDQELFFEIDIRDLLAKHNEKRIKTVDKKMKDRTEYLEPAKVRDLKMVVVTVATL